MRFGAHPIRGKGSAHPPQAHLLLVLRTFFARDADAGHVTKEFAMALRTLPRHPHLEWLKGQARQLLKAYRDGTADAAELFAEHPRSVPVERAKLTDAQLVLARAHGFDSWPRLRREVIGRQLRSAIWQRDIVAVGEAIDLEAEVVHGPGPHPMWGGQPDALQLACERGQVEVVRLLLERGVDVEGDLVGYGWSPLQLAAHWGHREAAQLLLEHGARLDICAAALLGDMSAVARMLDDDPSMATRPALSEAPPLHQATTREVADLLLGRGARFDSIDSMGNTPLGSAIARGSKGRPVAELLLERGAVADPCQLAALGQTDRLVKRIQADAATVTFTGPIGVNAVVGTPLHAAVNATHVDTVTALLEHGADVNARADMGQTPLHLCQTTEVAGRLVEAGADPTAVDDEHRTRPVVWAQVNIEIQGDSPERRELVAYLKTLTPES
jgi:ankyrin repeat protein